MADNDNKDEEVTEGAEHEHKLAEHEDEPDQVVSDEPQPETVEKKHAKSGKLQEAWHWALANKRLSIPGAVLVLLVLFFAVPFTRYTVLGLFLKQEFSVVVLDSQTNKPVSAVTVTLDGKSAATNASGEAKVRAAVGRANLVVAKKYYKSFSQTVTVPVNKPKAAHTVKLEATGRPVPITILNSITSKPLAGAVVSAEKTQAKTDDKGQTVLVVPIDKKELKGTIALDGYNQTEVTIKATTEEDKANSFKLTPAGKIFLLSNQSGKIDLVKSDLDGSNRQTVLPGTGKEDRLNTVLLASRDWKYIALQSKRDGGEHAKLFLVEASTGKLTTIDEGEADFAILGWSDDRFVYTVTRTNKQSWEPKRQAIKSYDASTKKLTTLDETTAEGDQSGYVSEALGEAYVLDQEVLYVKNLDLSWYGLQAPQDRKVTFNGIHADGSQKKVVKTYTFPGNNGYISISTRLAEFGEIYIQYFASSKADHDEYKDGKISPTKLTEDEFYNGVYPSYVVSPSGKKTLWSDYRDGKYVFFVGDGAGENGKQIGASEDFNVYGWYTDDYLLLTKKGSEMRIMSVLGASDDLETSLKVGNYYKPNYYLRGYGYGYGG